MSKEVQPKSDTEVRELMIQKLWELEQLIPTSLGFCSILVDASGGINFFSTFAHGGKLPLLAGINLAGDQLVRQINDQ